MCPASSVQRQASSARTALAASRSMAATTVERSMVAGLLPAAEGSWPTRPPQAGAIGAPLSSTRAREPRPAEPNAPGSPPSIITVAVSALASARPAATSAIHRNAATNASAMTRWIATRSAARAAGGDHRSHDQGEPRAEAVDQAARPAREQEKDEDEREAGGAGRGRGVPLRLDEVERQEEEGASQGAVEEQRDDVGAREAPGAEDRQGDHRGVTACLEGAEREQRTPSTGERPDEPRLPPPQARGLDEPIHDAAEARGHQRRTEPVEWARRVEIPTLRHPPEEQAEHGHGDQQERGEKERVRLDDPLDVGDGGAELALQRRQGQVDDRAVDEGEARAEHRRGQHPRPSGLRARRGGTCRKDDALVTRGLEDQPFTR